MHYLLGVDDTDNLESRGTGHCVRQLAGWLAGNELAEPQGITRHQLLIDPQIPYTSHNSSACMSLGAGRAGEVWEAAREFLLRESAPGADVGLCLAERESVNADVIAFARRAKVEVLTRSEAEQTASRSGLRLAGLTGTGGGIIGALAAVGLHRTGSDGRFLWLPGLRELSGKYQVGEICAKGHVDRVCALNGTELQPKMVVNVGEWVRPILRDGKATLYVEEINHEWNVIAKEHTRRLSN